MVVLIFEDCEVSPNLLHLVHLSEFAELPTVVRVNDFALFKIFNAEPELLIIVKSVPVCANGASHLLRELPDISHLGVLLYLRQLSFQELSLIPEVLYSKTLRLRHEDLRVLLAGSYGREGSPGRLCNLSNSLLRLHGFILDTSFAFVL